MQLLTCKPKELYSGHLEDTSCNTRILRAGLGLVGTRHFATPTKEYSGLTTTVLVKQVLKTHRDSKFNMDQVMYIPSSISSARLYFARQFISTHIFASSQVYKIHDVSPPHPPTDAKSSTSRI